MAKEADADIFEIIPEDMSTADDLNYNHDNCRANQEMNDASARPAIGNDLSAVSEYDVIYLGFPIWWGTAPRIIQIFIENYDISGATVYAFCTSGSSGIEQSISDLQKLYPGVNISDGKIIAKGTYTYGTYEFCREDASHNVPSLQRKQLLRKCFCIDTDTGTSSGHNS